MSCQSHGASQSLDPKELPSVKQGDRVVTLTELAIRKISEFAEKMNAKGKPFRVFIKAGGCSGFEYGYSFDERREGDLEIDCGDTKVVIDPQSAVYLNGSTVDFLESFQGAGFTVKNPNSSGGCACGSSFSVS